MKKILVIHGPNLKLLGKREPGIYGYHTLDDINDALKAKAKSSRIKIEIFQSDHEGEIVKKIGKTDADALIINPAAYTHTSVAIADALAARDMPAIEVHLSNIYKREEFRRKSLVAGSVVGQITGFGPLSYILGFQAAEQILSRKK